ncbi:hypothetical protein B0H12DRAFT_1140776, partial [Mycena haematopus]
MDFLSSLSLFSFLSRFRLEVSFFLVLTCPSSSSCLFAPHARLMASSSPHTSPTSLTHCTTTYPTPSHRTAPHRTALDFTFTHHLPHTLHTMLATIQHTKRTPHPQHAPTTTQRKRLRYKDTQRIGYNSELLNYDTIRCD